MSHRILVALAVGVLVPAALARAAPLPGRPPPTGFASVEGASGGRTLASTVTGHARSAAAVLGGVLGTLRGYFDAVPAVSSAVGDLADGGIMAFFDARLRGTPVRGTVPVPARPRGAGARPLGPTGDLRPRLRRCGGEAGPHEVPPGPPSQYRPTD